MKPLKILLEVEITDPEWLGLDDYKENPKLVSDLDVFNRMAEDEGGALNALVNICDCDTTSRFIAVSHAGGEDVHLCFIDRAAGSDWSASMLTRNKGGEDDAKKLG